MRKFEFTTWAKFKDALQQYALRDLNRRSQVLFRGQSDSRWSLKATLDRRRNFASDQDRLEFFALLLREFRREAIGLTGAGFDFPVGDALELLARHHGLPSTLIDWTESPYIAAFFAFDSESNPTSDKVAIWMLDRAKVDSVPPDPIDILDDRELLRFNVRAIEQRGVFTRILSISDSLENLLGDALVKFELPVSERRIALIDLDIMTITAKCLFRDLDAAGRTAVNRVFR